jgi:hypothetical protein
MFDRILIVFSIISAVLLAALIASHVSGWPRFGADRPPAVVTWRV